MRCGGSLTGDMDSKGLNKQVNMRVVGAKPSVLRKVCVWSASAHVRYPMSHVHESLSLFSALHILAIKTRPVMEAKAVLTDTP